jgi:F420-dependent oxidoreductase-like protein
MKLGLLLDYSRDFHDVVDDLAVMEDAGLDQVWVPEPYGCDAISQVGFLAARTRRLEIGTGIINVFSRTPALVAMTAVGCDDVSAGRFNLGLGASGPQVVEGFHGVPFERPLTRVREYIESCRMIWRREPFVFCGQTVQAPLMAGRGTGLGKPTKLISKPRRSQIPIWWASLKGLSVSATAEVADGWLPTMFLPERHRQVWGAQLDAGLQRRSPDLGPLQIAAGGFLAIDDNDSEDPYAVPRAATALYVGGMGAPGKNFYNDLLREYGYEQAAARIQQLFLSGQRAEAEAQVPRDWLELTNLVGSRDFVRDRVAAYRDAGVTALTVTVGRHDPVGQIRKLRSILDE